MNSRERVYAALAFQSPDRAPRDLWELPWAGRYLRDERAALLADFPMDIAGCGYLARGDRARGEPFRQGSYVDDWGCVWQVGEDSVLGEVKGPPLADWSALAAYRPPWEIVERADPEAINRAQAANLAEANPRFLLVACEVHPFERLQYLRGSENLYLDLGEDSMELRRLVALVHEVQLKQVELAVRTDCDGIALADDWGSQRSLLISPEMWRHYFKPLYKDYCDLARRAGKKIFFHSDGEISSIYADLIELGVNAINSQLFCMDIEDLARRYRGQVTFWGEIDRQAILAFGTAEDVRRAVGRVRRALDDGRGGLIAQCEWGKGHPAANIRAVYQAWMEPLDELPR
jgi:hypothetical protein